MAKRTTKSKPAPAPALHFASHATLLAVADGDLPEWYHLIPAGVFSGRDGRGPYSAAFSLIAQAFATHGMPLLVDYEHQSLMASDIAGPVPAAGWITDVQERADGVWGRIEWTERAAELIRNAEYRYLSPVFGHDDAGRVTILWGAGLTNNPNLFLNELLDGSADSTDLWLAAARRALHAAGFAIPSTDSLNTGGETLMDKDILDALGLAEDADTAAALAAIDALKGAASTANAAHAALATKLGLTADADAEAIVAHVNTRIDPAQYVPVSAHKAVADELAALKTAAHQKAVDGAVNAAVAAGKVAPAMRDWAHSYASKDLAGFEAYVAAAPVIADGSAQGSDTPADDANVALDKTDELIVAAFGLKPESYAAHKR